MFLDRLPIFHGLPSLAALLPRIVLTSDFGHASRELGLSHQRVRQLVIKLHAQGRVSFGDPDKPFWIMMRAGDKTPLLSRDEEHVLSAIPREYATDATKIRLAARMPEHTVQQVLERLVASRFVQWSPIGTHSPRWQNPHPCPGRPTPRLRWTNRKRSTKPKPVLQRRPRVRRLKPARPTA